jgi:antitoxin CptB
MSSHSPSHSPSHAPQRASGADPAAPADAGTADGARAVALRRLRWQARRGMLENDLLLGRFLDRHAAGLDAESMAALGLLLELPDGELLDLALGRSQPGAGLDSPAVRATLERLRAA